MIVSLKKFQEKYGLLDEACRQWCALSKDNNSLLDGVGFGDFYKKLSVSSAIMSISPTARKVKILMKGRACRYDL